MSSSKGKLPNSFTLV
uniref:Uncharacterized protein n=1 Tax=Arundo donax TaxID=35708 RepID=A0A0A8YNQ3_ARUDO